MRVVIMGNSGSGKSTLARRLAGDHGIPVLCLDAIAFEDGPQRKPLEESIAALTQFMEGHPQWIIEGCYGDLIEAALTRADELRFLNPGTEACVRHCLNRPWEPDKFATPEDQQAMLAPLLDWVREYESRTDEFGLARHRAIFAAFPGNKQTHTSVDY